MNINKTLGLLVLAVVLIAPACRKTRKVVESKRDLAYRYEEKPVALAMNGKEGFDDFDAEPEVRVHRHITQHELHMMQEEEAIANEGNQHPHHPGHITQRERQLMDMEEAEGCMPEEMFDDEIGS